jgi:ankyrin repeat protein
MNLSERDAKDGTLLHRAVKRQDKDWVRWLVEHGAEVNVQDAQGMTPLHEEAYAKGDGTVAELLFIAGADESIPNKEGLNALHYAALASNLATLRKFINYTTNINEADSNGDTLLHHAADDDWIVPGRITELVRAGADVHARNNKGQTPLHVAVGAQRNDTAHDLLRCQASINAIDDRGRSPIIVLLDTYGLFFDSTLGKYEVGEGAYSALPRLFTILMEQEPDVMLRDDRGASALNVALSLYLKWQEKDAFEPECRNPSPSSSLKSKFKTWMKKDLMGLGAGRREPRVKIPAEVHYIWRRLILPTLQNAELDQSLVELMADDLEVADDLNFRSQDTEDSRGRIDARK